MGKQEEFDLGIGFDRTPKVYRSGPYTAHHYSGETTASVYHSSDPGHIVDTINVRSKGGPQVALNTWHAAVRKGTR